MWKKVSAGIFLAFILVSQISYFPPRGGGGGGGGYGAGFGLVVNGSNLDVNTAVVPSIAMAQNETFRICRSTNGTDSYSCSLTQLPTLGDGTTESLCVLLTGDVSSSGPATLDVNGLGGKALQTASGGDATVVANKPTSFCYDGTQFVAQGGGGGASGATKQAIQLLATYSNGNGGAQAFANTSGASGMNAGFPADVPMPNTGTPALMWPIYFPSNWNAATAITVNAMMSERSGNSGTYRLHAAFKCIASGAQFNAAFSTGSYNTSSNTGLISAPSITNTAYASMTSVSATGCAAGQVGYLAIWRDNSVGTLAGAINMVHAVVEIGVQ